MLRLDICSITSPSRRKAIGRGSTILAEAITIITPTKPSICQSGHWVGCGVGVIGVGDGIASAGVGEAGILVLVGVAEGKVVETVVGADVEVKVGQIPSGTDILPTALVHKL